MKSLAKVDSITPSKGRFLYHLVRWLSPDSILELGTCIGFSTAYMALGNPKLKLYSLEGCPETIALAKKNLDALKVDFVHIIEGDFDQNLESVCEKMGKIDLVYLDGNHQKDKTLNYFARILPYLSSRAIVIADDIYWSKGMQEAWQVLKNKKVFQASLDLFEMGILIRNTQLKQTQHYKIVPARFKPWITGFFSAKSGA